MGAVTSRSANQAESVVQCCGEFTVILLIFNIITNNLTISWNLQVVWNYRKLGYMQLKQCEILHAFYCVIFYMPVRKENVVALQRAEMRMVRWMCGVKLKDRLPSKELRERLGVDDIALILQQNRLRWYGHVLRKDDDDWMKKCMEYEVEGSRPRGRPKRTWKEVVREDCQARKLNK